MHWEIVVPQAHEPKYKKIVAKVYEGEKVREHLFSRDMSVKTIERQLLILYKDGKEKLLEPKENPIRVLKDDKELVTIIESDGCIISICEDDLLSGTVTYEQARYKRNQLMKKLMKKKLKKEQLQYEESKEKIG